MNKRERIRHFRSVFDYLDMAITVAFHERDDAEFDWYSDGQQALLQIVAGKPINVTPRVKSIRDVWGDKEGMTVQSHASVQREA